MTESKTHIARLATVTVHVNDQEAAVRFYTDVLGFEVRMDAPFGDGARWIEVAPPGGEATIALTQAHEGAPAGVDTGLRLATTDPESDHAALLAASVDADPEIMRWPGVPPMFTFRDPDRNVLYVVERT
jgi:catechol 2,3-dioxygenase-like lactoylglutathione lyase family enzyme